MRIQNLIILLLVSLFVFNCKKNTPSIKVVTQTKTDANGMIYKAIKNDPTGLRLYTLDNGLTVYLSKNTDEPKIQTYIAVRAGSNYDPKKSTGLAHYLEHMLFKGTDQFGTIDWEKEKQHLDKIYDLYEKHRVETDPEKKLAIYKQIDEASLEASNYSVANEYDKMVSSLGAQGTNAHTWFEETVYKNKIPSNELNKWLYLESNRFKKLVLRLFHTELEAVFEEFNRGQDSDGRKIYAAMLDGLFPKHPYGQQTTIGKAEHLKNPSLVDIHNYFETYYVPNNMALVLVGDIDFEKTIQEINNTFGALKNKEVKHPKLPKEEPLETIVTKEVFGPTNEKISIAFRANGVGTKDEKLVTLCDMILTNGNAGLIDLNLNQKQLVQSAGCSTTFLNDYGYHRFYGYPKEGQLLDEVKQHIFSQINALKRGEFEDWMIEAVVNDLKKSQLRRYENSTALASAYFNAFIHHQDWKDKVTFLDDLKKITKQELVAFANQFYKDNYVIVYKRKAEDKNIVKVSNPKITPVNLNREKQSNFVKGFYEMPSGTLAPAFVDYKDVLKQVKLDSGIEVTYVNNNQNDLFDLNIIFDMGKDHSKKLNLAVGYLEYLGTNTYSPEALKKEFYKLGIDYNVHIASDKSYVSINGLKENLDKGLELLEHLWNNAEPNTETYEKYVQSISKGRQNTKTSKGAILRNGLINYAKYGENSRLRNIYTITELEQINPEELVTLVKGLKNYKQRVFYYGKDVNTVINALNSLHKVPSNLKDYPQPIVYKEKETGGKVYFVNYDMVQAEMVFLAKGDTFDPKNMAEATLFNTYFGGGLSSIIFQEIRESKSLAYSAWSAYSLASKKEDPNYVMAYIGTQANKLTQAVDAMMELMNDMPEAKDQFKAAKEAALKKIAAQRITKSNIFWSFERLKKRGLETDIRKEMYERIKEMSMDDLIAFFNNNIKDKNYSVMVIANKKDINFKTLETLGEVEEMDVDYLFNFEKSKDLKQ